MANEPSLISYRNNFAITLILPPMRVRGIATRCSNHVGRGRATLRAAMDIKDVRYQQEVIITAGFYEGWHGWVAEIGRETAQVFICGKGWHLVYCFPECIAIKDLEPRPSFWKRLFG